MTLPAAGGPPGAGTGPVPLSVAFSDRAGEETFDGSSVNMSVDPLANVLRTLDTIAAAESEVGDDLRAVVGTPAEVAAAPSPAAAADPTAPGVPTGAVDSDEPRTVVAPDTAAPESTGPGQARREAILDGASALFAERGYHGASLRDISRRVGISHPGMLHHFASKDALLGAVIDRLEAHAQGLLDSVESLQGSPATLLAALSGPWNPTQHSMALLATLSAEIVNPSHPGRYRVARLRLVHEHVLDEVLTGLAGKGMLVPGADPAFVARTLFSLLLSLTVREHSVRELQQNGSGDPTRDVRDFVHLCVID
ncbi:MAG: TetR/AcrR family transcriptional regulator [Brachybacterium sp.]|uniref:TetR/AcrR family transcriptional regulator n=1 Tax=Brachybacterium sp. TaxID=1891286 RepID=UPI0026472A1A|nr:TetR/AcrR family transcriptional regulator [Brachybacterium sp.]MDN5688149.1 TetR/AcrR family transcriptional regulator [Brachybacterium sp.]